MITVIVSIFAIMALLVILVLSRSHKPLSMRPKKQHMVLKVVFGTIGLGVLIAFAAKTLISIEDSYKTPSGPACRVLVPAQNPAPIPEPTNGDKEEIKKMRLLVHMVVCKTFPNNFPVNAKVFEIQWPRDKNNDLKWESSLEGKSTKIVLRINSISSIKSDGIKLHIEGSKSIEISSALGSSSRYGGFHIETLTESESFIGSSEPWSLYVFFIPVLDNDPLKEVSLATFLKAHSNKLLKGGSVNSNIDPSFFIVINHLGFFSLLLVIAAICLAKLFPHKVLGFAGVLAIVILFTATLDRIALGEHLARVKDKSLPVETRMSACEKSINTLFYPKTASNEMKNIADDATVPEDLRLVCKQFALGLNDR